MTSIIEEFSSYAFEGDKLNELRVLTLFPHSFQQFRVGPIGILLDLLAIVDGIPERSKIAKNGKAHVDFRLSIARHRAQDGAFPFSHPRDVEALGTIVLFHDVQVNRDDRQGCGSAFIETSSRAFVECRKLLRNKVVNEITMRTYFPPRKPEPGVTVGAILGLSMLNDGKLLCSIHMESGKCVLAI